MSKEYIPETIPNIYWLLAFLKKRKPKVLGLGNYPIKRIVFEGMSLDPCEEIVESGIEYATFLDHIMREEAKSELDSANEVTDEMRESAIRCVLARYPSASKTEMMFFSLVIQDALKAALKAKDSSSLSETQE